MTEKQIMKVSEDLHLDTSDTESKNIIVRYVIVFMNTVKVAVFVVYSCKDRLVSRSTIFKDAVSLFYCSYNDVWWYRAKILEYADIDGVPSYRVGFYGE